MMALMMPYMATVYDGHDVYELEITVTCGCCCIVYTFDDG
jgi:hypothetical protein